VTANDIDRGIIPVRGDADHRAYRGVYVSESADVAGDMAAEGDQPVTAFGIVRQSA
jgi:hypothetical protein